MSLSKMPNEVLSSVLNNRALPFRQRLRLRLLSSRCCAIIEEGFKKKSSLILRRKAVYTAYTEYLESKPDHLLIPFNHLTEAFSRILVRLFSGTTQLTLNFGRPKDYSWRMVPYLFDHLGTNLTSIKLYGGTYGAFPNYIPVKYIADALNERVTLTSLTIFSEQLIGRLLPSIGPLLSRLEAFACEDSYINASLLSSSLSPRCTHLFLDHTVFSAFTGPFLAQLSTSLTHLNLLSCDTTTIWQSLSQMHALTSLTLDLNASTPYEELESYLDASLFLHLVPFTRLTDVKLYRLTYRTPLGLHSNLLPSLSDKLSTIKRLTLEVNFGESLVVDYQAFFQAIGVGFPNLVKLTIITKQDTIPAIQASLGKLSFSVEIRNSVDKWSPDW